MKKGIQKELSAVYFRHSNKVGSSDHFANLSHRILVMSHTNPLKEMTWQQIVLSHLKKCPIM